MKKRSAKARIKPAMLLMAIVSAGVPEESEEELLSKGNSVVTFRATACASVGSRSSCNGYAKAPLVGEVFEVIAWVHRICRPSSSNEVVI
jgi:hypothetical protein